MEPHDHMGIAEVAELLGISRQRVHAIKNAYADFPAPTSELVRGPIWHSADVLAWKDRHFSRTSGRPRRSG
jgi:predicted DNA-binding transcriptional regulator AlpA